MSADFAEVVKHTSAKHVYTVPHTEHAIVTSGFLAEVENTLLRPETACQMAKIKVLQKSQMFFNLISCEIWVCLISCIGVCKYIGKARLTSATSARALDSLSGTPKTRAEVENALLQENCWFSWHLYRSRQLNLALQKLKTHFCTTSANGGAA